MDKKWLWEEEINKNMSNEFYDFTISVRLENKDEYTYTTKVSYLMNKGFTLIEILISLVILSMIAVISSNILQSSLELERTSTSRLAEVRNLNFSSVIIRRDIEPNC